MRRSSASSTRPKPSAATSCAQLADGVYEAAAALDDDGVARGEPVRVHAKVTIAGGDMTIDLSGCSRERRAAINSRTLAGARVAYKALTGPLDPVNEGSFRALDVIIPEGNIMMARFPAPMSGWSAIVPTVVDTIVAALAQAMPDRVPAGHHGLLGGAVVFFGVHPKTKRRFVVQSLEGGGWGGRPFEDGESGTVSVCQGDVRNGSIEGIELKCPVLVEGRALRTDSGGAGKHRGGLGIDMRVRNLVEGKWNFEQTRRSKCPPWGLWGGKPGEYGDYLLRLPGETEFRIHGGEPPSGAGASRRSSCAPAAAAAGAIRSSASPRSGARRRGGGARLARARRARTTASCCATICRSTRTRPAARDAIRSAR